MHSEQTLVADLFVAVRVCRGPTLGRARPPLVEVVGAAPTSDYRSSSFLGSWWQQQPSALAVAPAAIERLRCEAPGFTADPPSRAMWPRKYGVPAPPGIGWLPKLNGWSDPIVHERQELPLLPAASRDPCVASEAFPTPEPLVLPQGTPTVRCRFAASEPVARPQRRGPPTRSPSNVSPTPTSRRRLGVSRLSHHPVNLRSYFHSSGSTPRHPGSRRSPNDDHALSIAQRASPRRAARPDV